MPQTPLLGDVVATHLELIEDPIGIEGPEILFDNLHFAIEYHIGWVAPWGPVILALVLVGQYGMSEAIVAGPLGARLFGRFAARGFLHQGQDYDFSPAVLP